MVQGSRCVRFLYGIQKEDNIQSRKIGILSFLVHLKKEKVHPVEKALCLCSKNNIKRI